MHNSRPLRPGASAPAPRAVPDGTAQIKLRTAGKARGSAPGHAPQRHSGTAAQRHSGTAAGQHPNNTALTRAGAVAPESIPKPLPACGERGSVPSPGFPTSPLLEAARSGTPPTPLRRRKKKSKSTSRPTTPLPGGWLAALSGWPVARVRHHAVPPQPCGALTGPQIVRGPLPQGRLRTRQLFRHKIECYPKQVMNTAPACG